MVAPPLTLVLGKGGVGKTTLARGLAAVPSAGGAPPLVLEPGLGAALAAADAGVPVERLDEHAALAAAAADIFGSRRLADGLLSQFAVRRLAAIVPGLREVALLVAAMERAATRPVIVDMPATGHGVAWLATVRLLRSLAPAGRARALVEQLDARLHDPAWTRLVVVTLPEPLVARETDELCAALPRAPDLLVINAVHRPAAVPAHELAAVAAIPALAAAAAALARWARPATLDGARLPRAGRVRELPRRPRGLTPAEVAALLAAGDAGAPAAPALVEGAA